MEISDLCKMGEVEPIEGLASVYITERAQLQKLIEYPLLEACEWLYDLNIQTMNATANKNNCGGGKGGILINYSKLSEANKKIAEQIGEVSTLGVSHVLLPIYFDRDTTVGEVKAQAMSLVGQFKPQKMNWAQTFTLQELCSAYRVHETNVNHSFFEKDGFFYDHTSHRFYSSKEHYEKVQSSKDLEG